MVTNRDINKKIVMFRKPKPHEWDGIGEIIIECKIGETITLIEHVEEKPNSYIKTSKGGWYPACCFKLFEEFYEIY